MRLSKEKRDKISEQVLSYLYHNHPVALFTVSISRELARDEEFIKSLMLDLKKKGLVIDIRKNPQGIDYSRRIRWRLSNNAYNAYKQL
jgi:prolyl-tRNA editing enzyme YbaK/EbsC (Cys-tRNA(Pro) deacylase)